MWFIGCAGCLRQVPNVKTLQKKYGIAVVGFNANDSEYVIQKYSSDHEITWPQFRVKKEILNSLGNDCSYPYNILVNENGEIFDERIGK